MKTLLSILVSCVFAFGAFAADTPPETPPEGPPAFVEYEVPGVGTVIAPEGEPGYRVRLPDGRVTAYPAVSGAPSEANAAADIAYAIANPPAAPVPASVTRRQLLLALFRATGVKESDILAVIAAISDANARYEAELEFKQASEFRRDHPLVAQLATALTLNSGQVDAIFRTAATL